MLKLESFSDWGCVSTNAPTNAPTLNPTAAPTLSPTSAPTFSPTNAPTFSPTAAPTFSPTNSPTLSPTAAPTLSPTSAPTLSPTAAPTLSPTNAPTLSPTNAPTLSPTSAPTSAPVPFTFAPLSPISPTSAPIRAPTSAPIKTIPPECDEALSKMCIGNIPSTVGGTSTGDVENICMSECGTGLCDTKDINWCNHINEYFNIWPHVRVDTAVEAPDIYTYSSDSESTILNTINFASLSDLYNNTGCSTATGNDKNELNCWLNCQKTDRCIAYIADFDKEICTLFSDIQVRGTKSLGGSNYAHSIGWACKDSLPATGDTNIMTCNWRELMGYPDEGGSSINGKVEFRPDPQCSSFECRSIKNDFEKPTTTCNTSKCIDCIKNDSNNIISCQFFRSNKCMIPYDPLQFQNTTDQFYTFFSNKILNSTVFLNPQGIQPGTYNYTYTPYAVGQTMEIMGFYSQGSDPEQTQIAFEKELAIFANNLNINYIIRINVNIFMASFMGTAPYADNDYTYLICNDLSLDTPQNINNPEIVPPDNYYSIFSRTLPDGSLIVNENKSDNICGSPIAPTAPPEPPTGLENKKCASCGDRFFPDEPENSWGDIVDYLCTTNNIGTGYPARNATECVEHCVKGTFGTCNSVSYSERDDKSQPLDCNDPLYNKYCVWDGVLGDYVPGEESGWCQIYSECKYTTDIDVPNVKGGVYWADNQINTESPQLPSNVPPFYPYLQGCAHKLKDWKSSQSGGLAYTGVTSAEACYEQCSNYIINNFSGYDWDNSPAVKHPDRYYSCTYEADSQKCRIGVFYDETEDCVGNESSVCTPFILEEGPYEGCLMQSACNDFGAHSKDEMTFVNWTVNSMIELEVTTDFSVNSGILYVVQGFRISSDGTNTTFEWETSGATASVTKAISGVQTVKFMFFDANKYDEPGKGYIYIWINEYDAAKTVFDNPKLPNALGNIIVYESDVSNLKICGGTPVPPSICSAKTFYFTSPENNIYWTGWDIGNHIVGINIVLEVSGHSANDTIVQCANGWRVYYPLVDNLLGFELEGTQYGIPFNMLSGTDYSLNIYIDNTNNLLVINLESKQIVRIGIPSINKSNWDSKVEILLPIKTINICGGSEVPAPTAAPTMAPTNAPVHTLAPTPKPLPNYGSVGSALCTTDIEGNNYQGSSVYALDIRNITIEECTTACDSPPPEFEDIGYGCTGFSYEGADRNDCFLFNVPIQNYRPISIQTSSCNIKQLNNSDVTPNCEYNEDCLYKRRDYPTQYYDNDYHGGYMLQMANDKMDTSVNDGMIIDPNEDDTNVFSFFTNPASLPYSAVTYDSTNASYFDTDRNVFDSKPFYSYTSMQGAGLAQPKAWCNEMCREIAYSIDNTHGACVRNEGNVETLNKINRDFEWRDYVPVEYKYKYGLISWLEYVYKEKLGGNIPTKTITTGIWGPGEEVEVPDLDAVKDKFKDKWFENDAGGDYSDAVKANFWAFFNDDCADCMAEYLVCMNTTEDTYCGTYNNRGENGYKDCIAKHCGHGLGECIGLSQQQIGEIKKNIASYEKDDPNYNGQTDRPILPIDFYHYDVSKSKVFWANTFSNSTDEDKVFCSCVQKNFDSQDEPNAIRQLYDLDSQKGPIDDNSLSKYIYQGMGTGCIGTDGATPPVLQTITYADAGNNVITSQFCATKCNELGGSGFSVVKPVGSQETDYYCEVYQDFIKGVNTVVDRECYPKYSNSVLSDDNRYGTIRYEPIGHSEEYACCVPANVGWISRGNCGNVGSTLLDTVTTWDQCNEKCKSEGYDYAAYSPKSSYPKESGYESILNVCSCYNDCYSFDSSPTLTWPTSASHPYSSFLTTKVNSNEFHTVGGTGKKCAVDSAEGPVDYEDPRLDISKRMENTTRQQCEDYCKNPNFSEGKFCAGFSYNETTQTCVILWDHPVFDTIEASDWNCYVHS